MRRAALVAGVLVALACGLAGPVRSTQGGLAAVDEPQYLMTAMSIAEDGDLDIADELRDERWRAVHDTDLPVQTRVMDDGAQVSPHDPLLPLLLAGPYAVGGLGGVRLAMAVLAGVTAALVVALAGRFGVPPLLAGAVAFVAGGSGPLLVYGAQVYPEMPAGLAVLGAAWALTGAMGRGGLWLLGACVVALPWLGVKYAPVAAVLAMVALVRLVGAGRRGAAGGLAGGLSAAAAVYTAAHLAIWGGPTAYASGDHFVESGEAGVVGFDPDYAGRSLRLVALLADRDFGLLAWAPVWLLLVPALAAAWRARRWLLLVPVAAGAATATWVALTMHGYWWPGRQLVVVLPLASVAVAWWLARAGAGARVAALLLAAAGVATSAWLLARGRAGDLTWVNAPDTVAGPTALWRWALPDYRDESFLVLHLLWAAVLVTLALLGWHGAGRDRAADSPPRRSAAADPIREDVLPR